MIDLRLGDYRQTLDGETWDALICDPPYSERTHVGYNDGTSTANRLSDYTKRTAAGRPGRGTRDSTYAARKAADGEAHRRSITYAHWTPDDVRAFVKWAHPRTRGWMVCFTDDTLAPVYREAMRECGRLDFRIAWVNPSPAPRMCGDGPSNSIIDVITSVDRDFYDIIVSRPRKAEYAKWGSLPSHYIYPQDRGPRKGEVGGKPLALMREIIRDYSMPGDLVCDPCAGWGTTPIAARAEGRRAIASEMRDDAHAEAARRCAELPQSTANQRSLFDSP